MTDPRSPLAVKIIDSNPAAYRALLVEGQTPALAHELLDGVRARQLLAGDLKSQSDGDAMIAGLWLWHDALEECHQIAQNATETLNFWHAILHRREGDFSNSKYWYARCADHFALTSLAAKAPQLVQTMPADKSLLRLIATGWSPPAFVDLVEAVYDKPDDPRHELAILLQRLEWQVLFEDCTRRAAGL